MLDLYKFKSLGGILNRGWRKRRLAEPARIVTRTGGLAAKITNLSRQNLERVHSMELAAAGLSEQPFRTHGKPLAVVGYAAHLEALAELQDAYQHPTGLALLQGPALSGKSTIIREFVGTLPEACAVAVVDGAGMNTTGLLESLLRQFGYELDISSACTRDRDREYARTQSECATGTL